MCKKEVIAQKCGTGNDAQTNSPWVICEATANSAWISANNTGTYHPLAICQSLGYTAVGQQGGTCGNVCGYCQGATSCNATGNKTFDNSGVNSCGAGTLCFTVHWTCTK